MKRALVISTLALALAACGSSEEPAQPQATAEPVTLPDGSTPTDAEAAFLDQALPDLSDTRAQDPAGVLNEAGGYCRINRDPTDPDAQARAVDVLMRAGWTQTDAQVTVREAVEHLCP